VPNVHEVVLSLPCNGVALWGVVSLAEAQAEPRTGVVIVVGGPQYRVGSHRQFVQLARRLAREGHAVLRFDVRGMGDSPGEQVPNFTRIDSDIAAAVVGLRKHCPSVQDVALWGLCDGASAALMYVQQLQDPRHRRALLQPVPGVGTAAADGSATRVAALCLANPWVRSAATQAQTTVKHYYKDRLRQRAFWLKLLKGGVAIQALRDLWSNLKQARASRQPRTGAAAAAAADIQSAGGTSPSLAAGHFQSLMSQGWKNFSGPVLLLLSEHDYTAKEFVEASHHSPHWQSALTQNPGTRVNLVGTDHTCSDRQGRMQLEEATVGWLAKHLPPRPAAGGQA
jgi:uncharacterized protein